MDIGSILIILALLIVVALYIARPLYDRQAIPQLGQAVAEDHERSTLLAERDRILNAIQELDFDYALGKIPQEDYPQQRSQFVQRGAQVLRDLDSLSADEIDEDVEDRLEAAIAARRADLQQSSHVAKPGLVSEDDDLEAILAERRRSRQEKAAGFCPQCGGALQKSDRFCPKCGAKLA